MRRPFVLTVLFCSVTLGCQGPAATGTSGEGHSANPAVTSAASGSASRPAPAASASAASKADLQEKAVELAHKLIIVDTHIDVPWRLEESRDKQGGITEDVAKRTAKGDFDWERAKQGGLDAPFMSIYVPSKYETGGAYKMADRLIDMVEGFVKQSPDKFALAPSPQAVRANLAAGKISLCMGMENGSPIEHKLPNVKYFHDRGIRYITLTHGKDNHICDSSYDDKHTHKGLSEFGKKVVAEMNRVGIMVDVSHISDDAFRQVMEVSKVPVIASHSSCRHFTPGWERNMSDEMIQALAKKGGVVQINFGSGFLDGEIQKQHSEAWKEIEAELKKQKLEFNDEKAKPIIEEYKKNHPSKVATVEKVADHIDHVVKLAGAAHVGLGSDFDGVGDSLPTGLKDVSQYPNLVRVLLERGYSERDIEAILGGNLLRVWQEVEDHAKQNPDGGVP
jgi:membrane dipeptidase